MVVNSIYRKKRRVLLFEKPINKSFKSPSFEQPSKIIYNKHVVTVFVSCIFADNMRKRLITILIIAVIWLGAAGAGWVLVTNRKYKADENSSDIEVNVEYLSIHTTGGYTGRVDRLVKAYSEGDKFYLESSLDGGIRHELTRLEYVLCTDLDFQMLRDQEGWQGEDLTYDKIDYRLKGGETISLPQKSYKSIPCMIFFFERIIATPDYEITRADEIEADLGKYCYLHGSPDVFYKSNCFLRHSSYIDFYYGNSSPERRSELSEAGKDGIRSITRVISRMGDDSEESAEELKKIFKEFKTVRHGSQTFHYKVQTNDKLTMISMVDYEDNTYFYVFFDKDAVDERDILTIMTGKNMNRSGLYIALAAGTAVAAAAVVLVLVRGKKKEI